MAKRSKASAQDTSRAQRAVVVMEKKNAGWSFQEIGSLLGITRQAVHTIYWDERAKLKAEKAAHSEEIDARRDTQAERMEQIIKAWLPLATGQEKDENGLAILNKDAAAIVLKADERLSKLYGLDAPTRTDITSNNQTISGIGADLSDYNDDDLAMLEAVHRRVAERKAASEGPGALPAP